MTISEAELQSAVIDLARTLGWMVHHARPALRKSGGWSTPIQGDRGFPDLVLARRGVVIFAELKSARGKVSDEQVAWLLELSGDARPVGELGDGVHVWRPSSWLSGEIEEALR